MPGLAVRDIRRLARVSKAWSKTVDAEECWRLAVSALATEHGLYAPPTSTCWRKLFTETLWPARHKWSASSDGDDASGFRIRVAVRVRPRRHSGRGDGLVLPLHQRLRLLKKGEKLSFDDAALSRDEIAKSFSNGEELDEELLQALLEAQALGAVDRQAAAQAAGGPGGAAIRWADDDDGGGAAAADAAEEEPQPLTAEDKKDLAAAEAEVAAAEAAVPKAADDGDDKENGENAAAAERKCGSAKLLLVQPSRVVMFVPGSGVRPFVFPTVLDGKASQMEVYVKAAQDAVVSALNGLNACVLAYGQTGSGKTHTTFGPNGTIEEAAACARRSHRRAATAEGLGLPSVLPPSAGVVLRACEEVLSVRSVPGACCDDLRLSAQFVQIYDEHITDLLSGAPVMLREGGEGGAPFTLIGAAHVDLHSVDDALCMLRAGELHKRVAATAMNDASSRAHTIFLLSLTQARADDAVTSSLALVDLAGSEQLKQSRAVGQQRNEAVAINSSLLVLGKVIRALSEGQRHVPYHECKLTKLLRGAFGGASRTTAIVTCSSDDAHADNTVSSLRFGERCSTVTNTLNVARVSRAEAIATVDGALAQTEASLRSYEARGRTSLPAYSTLKARHASLSMRRRQLGA